MEILHCITIVDLLKEIPHFIRNDHELGYFAKMFSFSTSNYQKSHFDQREKSYLVEQCFLFHRSMKSS